MSREKGQGQSQKADLGRFSARKHCTRGGNTYEQSASRWKAQDYVPSDSITNSEHTTSLLNVGTGGSTRDTGLEDRSNLRSS